MRTCWATTQSCYIGMKTLNQDCDIKINFDTHVSALFLTEPRTGSDSTNEQEDRENSFWSALDQAVIQSERGRKAAGLSRALCKVIKTFCSVWCSYVGWVRENRPPPSAPVIAWPSSGWCLLQRWLWFWCRWQWLSQRRRRAALPWSWWVWAAPRSQGLRSPTYSSSSGPLLVRESGIRIWTMSLLADAQLMCLHCF